MKTVNKIYINGEFVTPHGAEIFDLINPSNNQKIGEVILADETDTKNAIAAAKEAFKTFSKSTVTERIDYLTKLKVAVEKRQQDFIDIMIEEYGGTHQFVTMSIKYTGAWFDSMIEVLNTYEFEKAINSSLVKLQPVGVVGIITPWNASNSSVCSKVATAIAAGCTVVIKPSEMSALQTQVLMEAFHDAGLPKGIINFVTGLGNVVGAELTGNPDVSKISFTGSTAVGKLIAKTAVDIMKRVTLELGGKSPNIILDDADLDKAVPMAVYGAYMNSAQACIAPTRLLVPENRLDEVNAIAKTVAENIVVGLPQNENTNIGPMVSVKQFDRVQNYIKIGLEEGATLLAGGEGKPEGLEEGNFVKATIFTNVNNKMRIAQEEIFGPVLSIIPYKTEQEAIEIANDSPYGLAAYVSSADEDRAMRVASQVDAGRICINGFSHDPLVPFGGFKQSGIGREYGAYGLEAYLEPKAILR
ncbi:aldehyde dehydrogenase family protein [Chryseobacterium balustinum]|uniref:Aldehyde dehydrogenase (NAD+) n=1 Tax=Chryseobacterium balustinum TaxID=246 RepID=A0AAX2IL79_9FLAO|nr:aldehyde dehydrogenase family protein [Chryseobacterium balustinum]AZB29847.1 aldehyde dehydrogenase family protein [Chryseobacterium balustinum]SKB95677.1 aldehyde dehydrogenase (NAD+) [Chryseobacterium balustinum]SQA90226.1 Putative aldehyde dehydrogenase SA1924 [Chryseobacterium balustinum]